MAVSVGGIHHETAAEHGSPFHTFCGEPTSFAERQVLTSPVEEYNLRKSSRMFSLSDDRARASGGGGQLRVITASQEEQV